MQCVCTCTHASACVCVSEVCAQMCVHVCMCISARYVCMCVHVYSQGEGCGHMCPRGVCVVCVACACVRVITTDPLCHLPAAG